MLSYAEGKLSSSDVLKVFSYPSYCVIVESPITPISSSLHPNIQNWNKIVFVQNKWWSFRISEFTKIIQSKESPRNVENWKLKRFQRMAFRTIFQNLSFCSEINFQSISSFNSYKLLPNFCEDDFVKLNYDIYSAWIQT